MPRFISTYVSRETKIKRLKARAAECRCELWWDRNIQLWTLTDNDTLQCDGHYYTGGQLEQMSPAAMAAECADLIDSIKANSVTGAIAYGDGPLKLSSVS